MSDQIKADPGRWIQFGSLAGFIEELRTWTPPVVARVQSLDLTRHRAGPIRTSLAVVYVQTLDPVGNLYTVTIPVNQIQILEPVKDYPGDMAQAWRDGKQTAEDLADAVAEELARELGNFRIRIARDGVIMGYDQGSIMFGDSGGLLAAVKAWRKAGEPGPEKGQEEVA